MKFVRLILNMAGALALVSLCACGSRQLVQDLPYVSTSSDPVPDEKTRSETKTVDTCHYSVFSIPLGTVAKPENAFAQLSEGAIYVNHLSMKEGGWSFGQVGGRPLFGKTCWTATGKVVKEEK